MRFTDAVSNAITGRPHGAVQPSRRPFVEATDPRVSRTKPRRRRRKGEITVQHRVEYAALVVLGAILRALPVGAASVAVGALLRAIMPLTSRHRRVLANLAHAMPERSEREHREIANAMWFNLGRVAGEAFHIDRLADDAGRVRLPDDFDRFIRLTEGGAITATAHIGNWEIAGTLWRRAGRPMAAIYQALHNPLAERYLRARRSAIYPRGLYPKGPRLGLTMVQLAREGVGIGLVADVRELRGVPVTFFGQPATGTPLPAMLARMTGRPLLAGAVLRERGVRFHVILEEVVVPHTDDRDRDVREATQFMHDAFERWIRAHPSQWMWTHRKWARAKASTLEPAELLFPAKLTPSNTAIAKEGSLTNPQNH